jgi:hypothetical protein
MLQQGDYCWTKNISQKIAPNNCPSICNTKKKNEDPNKLAIYIMKMKLENQLCLVM